MHSTLKLRDSDPHDDFAIAPDAVPAAWADKVLADISRDAGSASKSPSDIKGPVSNQPRYPASGAPTVVAAPSVDTTFRATAISDMPAPTEPAPTSKWAKSAIMLVFAVSSAAAAAAWQHHGDAAKEMISAWVPAFALTSSPENTALTTSTDAPATQAAAAEQPSPQSAAPAPRQDTAAAAIAAPTLDSTQLQLMARDLAAMAQQVEQLKAGIAELKASQQAMARDVAKSSEVKSSEVKPSELRPAIQNPRPRVAPPPRTATAPHRPLPAYPPAQAAASAPLSQAAPPPSPSTMPASMLPAPPPPHATARTEDDEPVVRPPMPLR